MSDAALQQRIRDLERQLKAERLAADRRNSPFKGLIEVTATPRLRNGRRGKPIVQTAENVITHRGLHWMLRAALGIHGNIGTTGVTSYTSTWEPASVSAGGQIRRIWQSGTTWRNEYLAVAAGIWAERFAATDYAEGQATMLAQINPFRYLILSDSATAIVASDDAIPVTAANTSRALTDAAMNHEQFLAVSSTNGFLINTVFAATTANFTVAAIGMANYTTGERAGSQAVLASTLDGAANDISIRYKFSYSIA